MSSSAESGVSSCRLPHGGRYNRRRKHCGSNFRNQICLDDAWLQGPWTIRPPFPLPMPWTVLRSFYLC